MANWIESCLGGASGAGNKLQAQFRQELDVLKKQWYDIPATEWTGDPSGNTTETTPANAVRVQSVVDTVTDMFNVTVEDKRGNAFVERYIHEYMVSEENMKSMFNGGIALREISFLGTNKIEVVDYDCLTLESANAFGRQKQSGEAVQEMAFRVNVEPTQYIVDMAPKLPNGVTEVTGQIDIVATSNSISVEYSNIVDTANLMESNNIMTVLIGELNDGSYYVNKYSENVANLVTGDGMMFNLLKPGKYYASVAYDFGDGDYRVFMTSDEIIVA